MARNTYKIDETLEEPFQVKHLLRASSYIKKWKKPMLIALILSGLGGAFGYLAPMVVQYALDQAVPDKNIRLLLLLVCLLAGIFLISVIFTTIRSRLMVHVSQKIIYDIRKERPECPVLEQYNNIPAVFVKVVIGLTVYVIIVIFDMSG